MQKNKKHCFHFRTLCLSLWAILVLSLWAEPSNQISSSPALAIEYYQNEEYLSAIKVFQKILANQKINKSKVHYNIGNCYYKLYQKESKEALKEIYQALSILNYEKALKYQPANRQTIANLKTALDPLPEAKNYPLPQPNILVKTLFFFYYLSFEIQLLLLIGILVLIAIFILTITLLKQKIKNKKIIFAFILVSALWYAFFTIQFTLRSKHWNYRIYAIVKTKTVLKSEPLENSNEVVRLPAGMKVKILRTEENWHQVAYANQTTGWLERKKVFLIN